MLIAEAAARKVRKPEAGARGSGSRGSSGQRQQRLQRLRGGGLSGGGSSQERYYTYEDDARADAGVVEGEYSVEYFGPLGDDGEGGGRCEGGG